MDATRLNSLVLALKSFLIEQKNRRIFFLAIVFVLLFFIVGTSLVVLSLKQSKKKQAKKTQDIVPSSTPAKISEEKSAETIQSLGYSIDCQLVVTTSLKKIYVKKLKDCTTRLNYSISPSKLFAMYIVSEKNKASQLFVYSLENNVEGQLQIISQPITASQFDKKDNFVVLLKDTLIYYFIPLIFSEYPGNYYKELNTFTNIDKRKIEISLPETKNPYAKILEQQSGLLLTDITGSTLFTIAFSDLELQLSPTVSPSINKNLLKWDKRIFFYSKDEFKTMDMDGSNELTHQFICDGIDVVPIEFRNNVMARSPDGKTLAFLVPTEVQMRDNPSWKVDILAGKKMFNEGELVLYDFVKSDCQKTGVVQSIQYRESFGFSPNGLYLAFVNKGVSLYNLQNRQDYQLASHNPSLESDSTVVTGPLVWDGESRFIYTLVSRLTNKTISSTKLVRVYFNERLDGTEQEIVPLSETLLFAVSPDGSKVLYIKDNQIYKYDVDRKLNSLFSNRSVEKINKLVWLRNGTIVSNIWYANENLYFINMVEMQNFHIDFNAETIVYGLKPVYLYDLVLKKPKYFLDKRMIEGTILRLFY